MYFADYIFLLKFVGIVFVSLLFNSASASIISSHVIPKPSMTLNIFHFCNYMWQDSKQFFFHLYDVFSTYAHISFYCYSTIGLNYIFLHQVYIYICMIWDLLMFLIHLFLKSCWTRFDLNILFSLEHILY